MTMEAVIAIVEEETGQTVTAETRLNALGMDSLDFLALMLRFPTIPDPMVPRIETVNDLYLADHGKL